MAARSAVHLNDLLCQPPNFELGVALGFYVLTLIARDLQSIIARFAQCLKQIETNQSGLRNPTNRPLFETDQLELPPILPAPKTTH